MKAELLLIQYFSLRHLAFSHFTYFLPKRSLPASSKRRVPSNIVLLIWAVPHLHVRLDVCKYS